MNLRKFYVEERTAVLRSEMETSAGLLSLESVAAAIAELMELVDPLSVVFVR